MHPKNLELLERAITDAIEGRLSRFTATESPAEGIIAFSAQVAPSIWVRLDVQVAEYFETFVIVVRVSPSSAFGHVFAIDWGLRTDIRGTGVGFAACDLVDEKFGWNVVYGDRESTAVNDRRRTRATKESVNAAVADAVGLLEGQLPPYLKKVARRLKEQPLSLDERSAAPPPSRKGSKARRTRRKSR